MNIEQIKADIAAYIGHDSAVIIDPQPTINKRGFPDVRGSRNFLGADIIALAADHEALCDKTRWIPIQSPNDLPDGHLWICTDGGQIGDKIVRRDGEYLTSFESYYADVVAYMPFIEPEPYQPEKAVGFFTCPKCGAQSGWEWDCSVCGFRRQPEGEK